jgi:hypothetical protein
MDPNENLREQRRIIAEILDGNFTNAQRLAQLVDVLDEWICKGGDLPDSWQVADGDGEKS